MVRWVVTETLFFTNPDLKYLNISPNTVVRLCNSEQEAWDFVKERVKLPLYSFFNERFKRNGNEYLANVRYVGRCIFKVHEHHFQ